MNVKNNPPLKGRDSKCKALKKTAGNNYTQAETDSCQLKWEQAYNHSSRKIAEVKNELF